MNDAFPPQPVSRGLAFVNDVERSDWDEALKNHSIDETDARGWWDWYERAVCVPWVNHESAEGYEELDGQEGRATSVEDLPLIVRDVEDVEFAGKVYPLSKEGLYRFLVLTQSVRNLILVRDHHLLPILQGLSGLQIHGFRDHSKSIDEQKEYLLTCSFIGLTCGNIAGLASSVLNDEGYRTRSVGGTCLENWNTYDNGHSLFEVFDPQIEKWILADLDMGFLFRREGGYLDAGEVWLSLQQNHPVELVPLANSLVDPFFVSDWGFNYFLRFRWKWQNEEGKMAWYRRIFQAMSISHDGQRLFVGEKERITRYVGEEAEVLPYEEWRERLYGG